MIFHKNESPFLHSLSPSYTVMIQATIHNNSSRFETNGKIRVRWDEKKENPASIRCLHDSFIDPLRLMTAALRFTTG